MASSVVPPTERPSDRLGEGKPAQYGFVFMLDGKLVMPLVQDGQPQVKLAG
jgi:predicted alpha/beta superfamily hydrolase